MNYEYDGNELASVDRSDIRAFRAYMAANPYYFKSIFGDMSIHDAYLEAMQLRENLWTHMIRLRKSGHKSIWGEDE